MGWMFPLPRLLAALLMVWACVAAAQAEEVDPSLLKFREGFSLRVPAGWQTVTATLDGPAPAAGQGVVTLLRLQTPENRPPASLTIVRDEGPPPVALEQDAIERLGEFAALLGARVEKMEHRASSGASGTSAVCEAETSLAGGARVFGCLALARPAQAVLRCYWQRAADDAQAKAEIEHCLASLKLELHATVEADSPPTVNSDLVNRWRGCLTLVEGQKGRGSGFLCQIEGAPWLITNAHVLSDNPNPVFTTLDRQRLNPGDAFLAVDHDICKLKMSGLSAVPEAMLNVESEVRIGDEVLVPGNMEGAGVITALPGKVVGIGPHLVEVDATFLPGNSGSPIFHRKSGKIIGLATFLTVHTPSDALGEGAVKPTVRRFGYRIDSVKTWEPVNWFRFYLQSAQLAKIKATSADFVKLFEDSASGPLAAERYQTPAIRQAIENYRARLLSSSHPSAADREMGRRSLFSDLRAATRSDIVAFDSRNAYDYFRRKVGEEERLRDELYAQLTREIQAKGQ
jgi:hypothetical protein